MTEDRVAFSPADELQRCGETLAAYWVLAVPPALASVSIVAVIFATLVTVVGTALAGAFFGGAHPTAGAGLGFGVGAIAGLAGIVLGFAALNVSQAVTMHASLDALAGRRPDLSASFRAVVPRLGDLGVSMFVSFLIVLAALALCFVLIGIPLLVLAVYFLIYVQAAVVIGGESAFAAIATSARIARTRVGDTVVLAIGVIAVTLLGSFVNGIVVHIPLVNLVAGFAIGGLTSAFVAMSTARFYVALRDVPAPVLPLSP